MALPLLAVGALAAGGAKSLMAFGSMGAAAEARKRAAMEELRRDDRTRATTLGRGMAAAGASGIEFGGSSMSTYLTGMAEEFRKEHLWQLEQAKQGKTLADWSNGLDLASSLGGALFKFGDANAWWQKPSRASKPSMEG